MQTREAFICDPVRTPVGKFGGAYRSLDAQALGATVVRALLERNALPPEAVEDVLFAQCYPSMDAPALGRVVALDAGLPIATGGLQIDRRCGSSLAAICYAAMEVQTAAADVVLAGGVESMSNVEHYVVGLRAGANRGHLTLYDRLDRGRVTVGSACYPVEGGLLEA